MSALGPHARSPTATSYSQPPVATAVANRKLRRTALPVTSLSETPLDSSRFSYVRISPAVRLFWIERQMSSDNFLPSEAYSFDVNAVTRFLKSAERRVSPPYIASKVVRVVRTRVIWVIRTWVIRVIRQGHSCYLGHPPGSSGSSGRGSSGSSANVRT